MQLKRFKQWKNQKFSKRKLHDSSINVNYGKTLLISKQIVNFDMLYVVFFPSEFCKIFPQSSGNAITENLDFKIFRGSMPLYLTGGVAPALGSRAFGTRPGDPSEFQRDWNDTCKPNCWHAGHPQSSLTIKHNYVLTWEHVRRGSLKSYL